MIARILKWKNPYAKVYVPDIFGDCDLYQNLDDIIDYSSFSGQSVDEACLHDVELKCMREHIAVGDTVLDVGASIGFYTLAASKFAGKSGTVIAIEPGPVSFALLSRNVYSNLTAGRIQSEVRLMNAAASNEEGLQNLFLCPTGESDNQLVPGASSYFFDQEPDEIRTPWPVRTLRLDRELSALDQQKLRYVKIDTQGHEYQVLEGLRSTVGEANRICLSVEYAPYLKAWERLNPETFIALILELGLTICDLRDPNVSVDIDYLLDQYGHLSEKKMTTLLLRKGF